MKNKRKKTLEEVQDMVDWVSINWCMELGELTHGEVTRMRDTCESMLSLDDDEFCKLEATNEEE